MKKGILAGLIFGLLFVSMIGFASAADLVTSVNEAVKSIVDIVKPVLEVIVGNVGTGTDTTDIFLAKVILMIVLLAITYSVVGNIPLFKGKNWVVWFISLGVAILGVRYLTAEMVNTIVLSHSATAVALTAILPFVIYFIFVETGLPTPPYTPFVRRVAWILYAAVFLGLWFVRKADIPNLSWIYPATAAVAFIMAWMDGTIQRWRIRAKIQKVGSTYKRSGAATIQAQIVKAQTAYDARPAAYIGGIHSTDSGGKMGTEAYLLDMNYLEKELEKLLK